jgi:hypothetical protein
MSDTNDHRLQPLLTEASLDSIVALLDGRKAVPLPGEEIQENRMGD